MMKQTLKENAEPASNNCSVHTKSQLDPKCSIKTQLNMKLQLRFARKFTNQSLTNYRAGISEVLGASQRLRGCKKVPYQLLDSNAKSNLFGRYQRHHQTSKGRNYQKQNGDREENKQCKLKGYKQQTANGDKRPIFREDKQGSCREKISCMENSSDGSATKRVLGTTLPCGFKEREQHREERSHFQKMSLVIDRKDKKCSIKENLENLAILASSIARVKTLIYKHYKAILVRRQPQQLSSIRFYCCILFGHFQQLITLLQSHVDQNDNYRKYLRTLKRHEPPITAATSFEQQLQCLLFYFSSLLELKRLYDVCSQTAQLLSKITVEAIYEITTQTIRLRHYLEFLGKFVGPPLVRRSGKAEGKDLWKLIYERKYLSKALNSTCH